MTDRDDFLAARYALGVAELEEIAIAETRLKTDTQFAALVQRFDVLFHGINTEIAAITPPPSVWDRIEQALDEREKVPGTATVRSESLAWEPFVPGVERRVLHADTENWHSLVLYKVSPGAEVGNHGHSLTEECLVLEGEIEVDGITLRAGDLHMAFPNGRHGPLSSKTGALVYIRGDLRIQP